MQPGVDQFSGLVHALATARVDGILIGGVAAAIAGSSRSTRDLDVLYRRHPKNHDRIVAALAPFEPYLRGAPPGLPFELDAPTIEAGGNFTLRTSAGDIDLLAAIAGGDYESLVDESSWMDVFGVDFRVLDLDALIRVKRAAGRPKDFEAIAELELIAEEIERSRRGD